jgi:predicted Ser/Thr protein kinase
MEVPSPPHPATYQIIIGNTIKYLTIPSDVFPRDTLQHPPSLFASLPRLPPGDWNTAHIVSRTQAHFQLRRLPGLREMWHPTRFEFTSLEAKLRFSPRTLEVEHPSIGGAMIAKHARFDWEIKAIEHEARIYRAIDGAGIAPEFLGHLCEGGRIIGFCMRKVRGRMPEISRADWKRCDDVLARLHALGFCHGGVRREEFVIDEGGRAWLLDFEKTVGQARRGEREEERRWLKECFAVDD